LGLRACYAPDFLRNEVALSWVHSNSKYDELGKRW
jgi:hypothetical protein